VEIDLTANVARLIDENSPSTANDDSEYKRLMLLPPTEIRMERRPNDIGYNPPEPLPAPTAVFTASV
jgi:hypothetical protein